MAGCLMFLAGPSGTFLNAQILYPDGGGYRTFTTCIPSTNDFRKHSRPASSRLKIMRLGRNIIRVPT